MDDFNILDNDNVKLKTNYIIAVTMLAVGVLMLVSIKTNMAYVFIATGILLLYVATAKRHDREKELSKIRDMNAFRAELERAIKFYGLGLMITEGYAIVVRPSLKVYAFDGMAKFEVGIAEGKEKVLFLTDNTGCRHKIARTVTGDGNQSEFDDAYRMVKNKFAS